MTADCPFCSIPPSRFHASPHISRAQPSACDGSTYSMFCGFWAIDASIWCNAASVCTMSAAELMAAMLLNMVSSDFLNSRKSASSSPSYDT